MLGKYAHMSNDIYAGQFLRGGILSRGAVKIYGE